MSDPIPPRHGETERWREEEVPACPICKGWLRAEILPRTSPTSPERGAWRCDTHGEVTPIYVTKTYEEGE